MELRCGCESQMVISRQKSGKYHITLFEAKHNHALQENVVSVTNFSEENFFLTKKYYIATKYIFRRYL